MEIRDFRAFVTVVEVGGFTRAAARLHVVQPTISQAIARLESELGVQLLERRPDGIRLTPAGSDFLCHAKTILNSMQRVQDDMAAHRGLSKGRVRLGIVPTLTPLLMAPLLRRLSSRYPGLDVHFEESLAADLIDDVRVGELDLAVSLMPAEAADLTVQALSRQPLSLVVSRTHRVANDASARLPDLRDEEWVSFAPGNPARRWLEKACRVAGFEPHVAEEIESPAEMKPYIETGRAIAMMPPWTFRTDVGAGTLKTIPLSGAGVHCVVASIFDGRHTSAAMMRVHEEIRSLVATAP